MTLIVRTTTVSVIALVVFCQMDIASAHEDMLIQRSDPNGSNKLLTGTIDLDALETAMDVRVFEAELEFFGAPQHEFSGEDPGFNALSDASPLKPASVFALPGDTALNIVIQPFSIGSYLSELYYWDALGPVSFAPAAPTTTLSIAGAVANDPLSPKTGTIDVTGPSGTLHKHHDFILASAVPATAPDEGVYLGQFILQMAGVNDSDPFWIVFGTEGTSHDSHEAAMEWVEATFVIPEPASLAMVLIGAIGLMLGGRRRNY
jgi:hypothetical protein